MTLRDQYALGLSAHGYQRGVTASKKYWYYFKPGCSPAHFWLGKSGGVRYGSLARIDSSVSASDATKAKLLAKGSV